MKRLFPFVLVSALALAIMPIGVRHFTWTQKQATRVACTANPSTVTITSTTAGSLLVVFWTQNSGSNTISSVTGAGTWNTNALCNANSSSGGGTSCAYNTSATGGVTSLTMTPSGSSGSGVCIVFEESYSAGPISLDTGTPQTRNSAAGFETNSASPTVTLAGSNDVVLLSLDTTAAVSACPTNYAGSTSGAAGGCSRLNTISSTIGTWTNTSGHTALSAIAFTESALRGMPPAIF